MNKTLKQKLQLKIKGNKVTRYYFLINVDEDFLKDEQLLELFYGGNILEKGENRIREKVEVSFNFQLNDRQKKFRVNFKKHLNFKFRCFFICFYVNPYFLILSKNSKY